MKLQNNIQNVKKTAFHYKCLIEIEPINKLVRISEDIPQKRLSENNMIFSKNILKYDSKCQKHFLLEMSSA